VSAADTLEQVDLFAALAPDERARLAPSLRRRRFARGAVIFLQGDDSANLYLVESGWVKIVLTSPEGKDLVLDLMGPGECFGELGVLDGEPRSADAIAHEDCHVLLLSRADFERFLDAHPRAARTLLEVLARRLRRDAALLAEAVFADLPSRLARALLQLSATQTTSAGMHVRTTQEELAGMLGASREGVNKWLGYFERRGLLRRQRGDILLLQPEALRP